MFRLNEFRALARSRGSAGGAGTSTGAQGIDASGETAFGQSTGLDHIRIGDIEVPTDGGGGVYLKLRHFTKQPISCLEGVDRGGSPGGDRRPDHFGRDQRARFARLAGHSSRRGRTRYRHPNAGGRTIAGGQIFGPSGYALALEELIILALGILLAVALPQVSASTSAAIGFLTIALVLLGGWFAFRYLDLFSILHIPPILGLMTAIITFYTYHTARRSAPRSATLSGNTLLPLWSNSWRKPPRSSCWAEKA